MMIQLRVKPNSKRRSVQQLPDGSWLAEVNAPPTDGKANAQLIAMLAEHFRVPKSAVSIRSGAKGKSKRVEIELDN